MDGKVIKLGYAPTRRSIFSAPDAIKYRGLTRDRLEELGVSFVDIDDINPEGLLYDDKDIGPFWRNSAGSRWTVSLCPTAISAQSMWWPVWLGS